MHCKAPSLAYLSICCQSWHQQLRPALGSSSTTWQLLHLLLQIAVPLLHCANPIDVLVVAASDFAAAAAALLTGSRTAVHVHGEASAKAYWYVISLLPTIARPTDTTRQYLILATATSSQLGCI